MNTDDFVAIRHGLASLDASANHTASGEGHPKVKEIFAPEQHAGALDPNTMIVLGARGAGKSFWAGVLGNEDTRAAAEAYPLLGLDRIMVKLGFTGQVNDGSVSRATIDHQVPIGQENTRRMLLWRCVVLRALQSAIDPAAQPRTIGRMMEHYADPEEWETDCAEADRQLAKNGGRVVVIFDALDALAIEWGRLRNLIDALLEVAWSMRGYGTVRLKLFLRQLRNWPLTNKKSVQSRIFMRLAGACMGTNKKKGNTYDWPPNHLADGHGEVTSRSFLTLMIQAARHQPQPSDQTLSAEGIRHGLREASKTRVEQLALEFTWIKRALSPLARMQVPCPASDIIQRWEATQTIEAIQSAADRQQFLPPFPPAAPGAAYEKLIETFIRIGVLSLRRDMRCQRPSPEGDGLPVEVEHGCRSPSTIGWLTDSPPCARCCADRRQPPCSPVPRPCR